jgi:hypothetical protein
MSFRRQYTSHPSDGGEASLIKAAVIHWNALRADKHAYELWLQLSLMYALHLLSAAHAINTVIS